MQNEVKWNWYEFFCIMAAISSPIFLLVHLLGDQDPYWTAFWGGCTGYWLAVGIDKL